MLQKELAGMGLCADSIDLIRTKDGVHVARVHTGGQTAVLKAFETPEYRREIANYAVLRSLGIRTLRVLAETDAAILLEDADASPVLRLGVPEDMQNPALAEKLAGWYRDLHTLDRAWVTTHGDGLYDENDLITPENLALVRARTGPLPVWKEMDARMDALLSTLRALPRTLTYNDFAYTNLIAARDGSFAFAYDYNLLGKGYAYADVRNVCSALSPAARQAFCQAYGPVDPTEQAVDAVADTLVTLIAACRRPSFPAWARASLQDLRNGFAEKLRRLP